MKLVKIILVLVVLGISAVAQSLQLPVIKSNSPKVSIRDGEKMSVNIWNLSPQLNPDVYEVQLIDGKPRKVEFITDVDSISFLVEVGGKYDFIIQYGNELCYTQIVGKRFIPAAVFDQKYQSRNKGKIFVEIPEVYELVNVAIAMTPTGINDKNFVYQKSDYYKNVRQWFDKYRNHPLLASFDTELKKSFSRYFDLKMDGYSFEFDAQGKIVQSKIYDRTGRRISNHLRPFLSELQSFADDTGFRKFYRRNKKTYDEQIRFYRDTANIAEMKRWLDKNFPSSNNYDTYKIIFSPLVASNQSTVWIESNGFKELHPHVNFPYLEAVKRFVSNITLSEKAEIIVRGNIVFTELNHGYIDPEANKYAERIGKAISNRNFWVDEKMGATYYGGISAFNEYMNWALVCLRVVDYVPEAEQAPVIAAVDEMMTKRRGFPPFAEFNKFLIDLYRNRKPGQTVADLYPSIIEWFEKKNQAPSSAANM